MIAIARLMHTLCGAALALGAVCVLAQGHPAPKEGTWIARDFRFHTGEVLPELRIHYTTIGEPTGEPVMLLHGTTGSGAGLLSPAFGGQLFGPGQPLDATKYYVILPDSIGHGKSSKPSDGLRAKFPRYNYEDMVHAQYLLATEGLGIRRLRLILGNSMGGMQVWIWGVKYPDFMDALVPMASMPTEMSSRNWMMRRLITDSIRNDPDWKNGEYTTQPRSAQFASVFYGIGTNGGDQAFFRMAPTREKADALLDQRLKAPIPRRRQRHPVPVGFVARLQPRADARAHPGGSARHQLGGRRAQPALARRHGARTEETEERPPVPDPGERADRRPRHDGTGEVVGAGAGGVPGRRAAAQAMSDRTQYDALMEVVRTRMTVRAFDPAGTVPREHYELILEAARHSPSGANAQPWHFIVITDQALKTKIKEYFREEQVARAKLKMKFPTPDYRGLATAPGMIVVASDFRWVRAFPVLNDGSELDRMYKQNAERILLQSVAAATMAAHLAAAALGYNVWWVTAIGQEKAQAAMKPLLGIPEELSVLDIMCFGAPAKPPYKRWKKSLGEIVNWNRFDPAHYLTEAQIDEWVATTRQKVMYKDEKNVD